MAWKSAAGVGWAAAVATAPAGVSPGVGAAASVGSRRGCVIGIRADVLGEKLDTREDAVFAIAVQEAFATRLLV
jgi:hypothetical protein